MNIYFSGKRKDLVYPTLPGVISYEGQTIPCKAVSMHDTGVYLVSTNLFTALICVELCVILLYYTYAVHFDLCLYFPVGFIVFNLAIRIIKVNTILLTLLPSCPGKSCRD